LYSIQAVDGADALDKTMTNKFDAIVTDIVMPKVDGITLTRELLERTPRLPIYDNERPRLMNSLQSKPLRQGHGNL